MSQLPGVDEIYRTIDATWPAAVYVDVDGWTIRKGMGGGSRVSAATACGATAPETLQNAEIAMKNLDQQPLFMIRMGDDGLDQLLEQHGYQVKDPVNLYACDINNLTHERPAPLTSFTVWPPLACQKEIWQSGGIGSERIATMARTVGAKTTLLGRIDETPVGTIYVALSGDHAMIHALEILPAYRRRGLAARLTIAAAFWAKDQGAKYMTLLTTKANEGANQLYAGLGMYVVGEYHYRIKYKGTSQ